jgi:hypothetical protein
VQAGVIPGEKKSVGRLRAAPRDLRRIAPRPVGRIEQMRECRRRVG